MQKGEKATGKKLPEEIIFPTMGRGIISDLEGGYGFLTNTIHRPPMKSYERKLAETQSSVTKRLQTMKLFPDSPLTVLIFLESTGVPTRLFCHITSKLLSKFPASPSPTTSPPPPLGWLEPTTPLYSYSAYLGRHLPYPPPPSCSP
jgi:hypothetical protein